MKDIIENQIEIYGNNFLKHGNSPQGTFQNDKVTQYERFSQLLAPLLRFKSNNFSICDVGSGLCDLHTFMLAKNIKHNYTGLEIVQEMIETSKREKPHLRILKKNVLDT